MPKTAKQLRVAARRLRTAAPNEPDPRMRRIMLTIADGYDELAKQRESKGNGSNGSDQA